MVIHHPLVSKWRERDKIRRCNISLIRTQRTIHTLNIPIESLCEGAIFEWREGAFWGVLNFSDFSFWNEYAHAGDQSQCRENHNSPSTQLYSTQLSSALTISHEPTHWQACKQDRWHQKYAADKRVNRAGNKYVCTSLYLYMIPSNVQFLLFFGLYYIFITF